MEKIAVLGAGSWGATLANLLAEKKHTVSLCELDPKAAQVLDSSRGLKTIPELHLSPSIHVSSNIGEVLRDAPVILSATPSHFVRSTMKAAKASGAIHAQAVAISVSKGLEE